MNLVRILCVASLLVVTFFAHADDDQYEVEPMDVLFGETPQFTGVEQFLISGLHRQAVLNPVEVRQFYADTTVLSERAMESFFSDYYLKHIYSPILPSYRPIPPSQARQEAVLEQQKQHENNYKPDKMTEAVI